MLQKLSIQNYALIDHLEMSPDKGLSIITGETGAGKSIMLGALSLILGSRADTTVLLNKGKKCIVEGVFNIKAYSLKPFFERHDLDYDHETIIRRQINSSGKSRAFVNDVPVRLNVLKEFADQLVDIHSQHQTLQLNENTFQLRLLDAFAGQLDTVRDYSGKYRSYKTLQRQLENLLEREKQAKADEDYYRFQLEELETAHLKAGEKEELEKELEVLENTEEIGQSISTAVRLLNEGDEPLISRMKEICNTVLQGSKFYHPLEELRERIDSARIELEDISNELENMHIEADHDPMRKDEVNERLSTIYKLEQKHHVQTEEELIEVREELSEKLRNISSLDEEIQALKNKIGKKEKELLDNAGSISESRKKIVPELKEKIRSVIAELGMPDAVIHIELEQLPGLGRNGIDDISFLFTANKGAQPKPVSKIASGGELSRLMLAIKSVLAESMALPTIIFDEIDTGVSGEVADKVGNILKQMGDKMQVIAITHLPQIAAKGSSHYKVFKKSGKDVTWSDMRQLDKKERLDELAMMLSGDKVSDAAYENAQSLLQSD